MIHEIQTATTKANLLTRMMITTAHLNKKYINIMEEFMYNDYYDCTKIKFNVNC